MGKADDLKRSHGIIMAESAARRVDPMTTTDVHTGPGAGITRLAGACTLLLENIIPDPTQPRTEFDQDELDRLAESIKQHGILAPLRVRLDPGQGKYCIIVGERRFRAAAQIEGLDRVPCIIVEGEPTERDILESQIAENVIRLDLNPIDQSRAYQRYMQLTGCTAKELSQLLHVSPPTISRALSLLSLPEEVQDAVSEGKISPKAGQVIAKIRNPEVAKKVAAKAAETKARAAEVEKEVRSRRGVQAKATLQQPFTQFKVRRGCRVVIHGRLTGREVLAALEAAVELARAALEGEQTEEQGEAGAEV
jgi:ParB family chromosome partitioning protein